MAFRRANPPEKNQKERDCVEDRGSSAFVQPERTTQEPLATLSDTFTLSLGALSIDPPFLLALAQSRPRATLRTIRQMLNVENEEVVLRAGAENHLELRRTGKAFTMTIRIGPFARATCRVAFDGAVRAFLRVTLVRMGVRPDAAS